MKKTEAPWEYLEDLNEIIYVTDIQTNELYYMNRCAREKYSISSQEDYIGKKCYRLLQGKDKPCMFCNSSSLKETKFAEWSYQNPVLDQRFLMKDTLVDWNGKKYRLEIAIDVDKQALEREELIKRLEYLSYHDQLTGALNRYALEKYSDGEASWQAVGVVYCDIVGLKNVNDLQGHTEGDRLIVRVFQTLAEIFSGGRVYRLGGDEFLAVWPCADENELEIQIDLLKRELMSRNCNLSIGSAWARKEEKNMHALVKAADESMYQAKERYYQQLDLEMGNGNGRRKRGEKEKRKEREDGPSFLEFTRNYNFDSEIFFQSMAMEDAPVYLFCGDMQKNMFFISDNLKKDFNFPDNLVYDFITLLEQRICEEDRQRHKDKMMEEIREKRTSHSIRYRIYNRRGEPVWIHCSGKMKWDESRSQLLFFSGSMILMDRDADMDPATGMKKLSSVLNRVCREQREVMILCFSLNSFAEINQLLGRRVGDEILWEIGCGLKSELGDDFVLARMDGMRFMALSGKVFDPEAPTKKIHSVVRDVYRRHGANIIYPCSVGLLRSPRDGADAVTLTENVSAVLYAAKRQPECRYLEFVPEMAESYRNRSDLEMALNDCINRQFEGFRLVIQPQIEAESGRIYGGEILLRWNYGGEDISPARFIPLLEFTGLIIPVGKWVINQMACFCRQILDIRSDFLISFNVSYCQISDRTLVDFLKKTLKAHQIPGQNILIELTENHSDEVPEMLEKFITSCKEEKIRFALDDFGSAYSSLQLLLKYPADVIKLDRALLKEITSSEEKKNFILSIVYACHRFGKKVCVEGVERKEELDAVLQTGCDYIQGFYFYKPMEMDELCKILLDHA
ncbi:MAG TPA: EAL domain-containing protein [Candidatus Eisenbergiella merdipullorum]|uniref:EAL domain-containing protein n=1 Tax=Candidatus Eisenbergiella merdipullorum TaxID=2838553 RepID=A0A9D2I7A4_9FIRM|nr:EAL domain-containing protein [Candidatus Eisenbergiella merdipullorum]